MGIVGLDQQERKHIVGGRWTRRYSRRQTFLLPSVSPSDLPITTSSTKAKRAELTKAVDREKAVSTEGTPHASTSENPGAN